jgi:membrane protease YdiL (CAAX protease family)
MQYRSPKDFGGWASLGILALFFIGGFILAILAQFIISIKIVPAGTGLDNLATELMKATENPANVQWVRLMQVLGTLCMLCIPAILYNRIVNGKRFFWMGFNKHVWISQVIIGFVIIFLANVMAAPLADLSKSVIANFPKLNTFAKELEDAYTKQVMIMSNLQNWKEYIIAIFIMAFFPALFEELFFRGVMQTLFEKWWQRPMLAILVTSIIFSLIHFSVYHFITRIILGFVLGYMFYKTKNIWVNTIAHFLNNAIAVTQMYVLSRQSKKADLSQIEPKVEWWIGVGATVVLIALMYFLEKRSAENKARILAEEERLLAEENPFRSFADNTSNQ